MGFAAGGRRGPEQDGHAEFIAVGEAEASFEGGAFLSGEGESGEAADQVVDAQGRGREGDVFRHDAAVEHRSARPAIFQSTPSVKRATAKYRHASIDLSIFSVMTNSFW